MRRPTKHRAFQAVPRPRPARSAGSLTVSGIPDMILWARVRIAAPCDAAGSRRWYQTDVTAIVVACCLAGLLAGPRATRIVSDQTRRTPMLPASGCRAPRWPDQGKAQPGGKPRATAIVFFRLLLAALFAAVGVRFGPKPIVVPYCLFFATLAALAAIDLAEHRLPRTVVYSALAASAPMLAATAALTDNWTALDRAGLGAIAGFGALFAIHVCAPNGMGFGDVRLAALVGLYLGWISLPTLAGGLFLSFLTAAVTGLVLILFRRGRLHTVLPFGPFLAGGSILAALFIHP